MHPFMDFVNVCEIGILGEAGQEHVLRVITGSSKSKKAVCMNYEIILIYFNYYYVGDGLL